MAFGSSESGGGAINNWKGTINSINANFKNNYVVADGTDIYSGGGAIGNAGTGSNGIINSITGNFTGNQAINSSGGGAITNAYYIGSVKGNFSGNMAGNAIYGGGAILNAGQMTVVDSNFTNNLVKGVGSNPRGLGGAIANGGTMTISAKESDVTFSGNYINVGFTYGDLYDAGIVEIIKSYDLTNAVPNDIATALGGTTTLNTASGHKMTLNGGLMDDGNAHWIKTGEGTLVLKSDNSAVYGDVQIQGGTVELTNNGTVKGTLFSNASKTTWTGGTTIDAQNGYIEEISLGKSAEILGDIYAKIDVNLLDSQIDKFVAGGTVTSTAGKIYIKAINMSVMDEKDSTATSVSTVIADANTQGALKFDEGVKVDIDGSTQQWTLTYDNTTGVLKFSSKRTLKEVTNDTTPADRVFESLTEDEVVEDSIGNIGNNNANLIVQMHGNTIDGSNTHSGFNTINKNQTLTINDADVKDFTSTGNGAFINDAFGAKINLNNSSFDNITTTGDKGGVIYAKNSTLKIDATSDGTSFTGNSAKAGGVLYEDSNDNTTTINGNGGTKKITFGGSGTGEGNSATSGDGGAIYTRGVFNATNVSFIKNTASGKGGAIYNYGKALNIDATIDGTEFSGNRASLGGAIYDNAGNTSSINLNANNSEKKLITFDSNTATGEYGGAIWTKGLLNATNVSFTNNTATKGGGAIYTDGKDTNIDATIAGTEISGNSAKSGGAIYNTGSNSSTVHINGNGGNKTITFDSNSATDGAGGAIYSAKNLTVNNAEFTSNTATTNGGAIYVAGTGNSITNSTFGSATDSEKGNTAQKGGAIYNDKGTIESIKADFYNNSASDSKGGGAIYNNEGTITIDSSSNNITFSGNTAGGVSNAIHSAKGTVNFDGTNTIYMNDRITSNSDATFIKQGTGALVLKEDMSGVTGNVQLKGGTVQLTNNGLVHGTFFTKAKKTTFGTGTTTKIDAQNTYTETINLGKNVALDGNINLYMDVDLSGTSDVSDKIVAWDDVNNVAGTVTGDGKIYINTINLGVLENIRLTSDVDAPVDGSAISRTIASTNLSNHLVVATDARVGLENSSKKWILTYDGDTGILSFNNGWTLPEAIASTADSVIYNALVNEPTLTADLGNLGGITTSVRMNGKTVDGGGHAGVNVVTAGQELGIENAVFTNFSKTGDGGVVNNVNGTVTLENVTIHDASATSNGGAVMNNTEGSLTISGSEFYDNESGYDGGAIYNGGSTFTISGTSSVHDNTANGNGGGIYVINQSANISGTTFTSNSAKKRGGTDGGDGGAYYAMNATTTMNNVTFNSNSAENSAGAFANAGGTATLTNATFTSNIADGRGGAIFNIGGGTTTVKSGNFTSNVAKEAFGGGAIFNDGDNSKVVIQNAGNTFTTNYAAQGGAIANFGSQIDVSKATFNGNKAISNSQGGGAILNNGEYRVGTLNITDSSFTNNLAANQGGAISNIGNATNSIVNITASGADITFSGNKQGIVFNPDGTINDDSGAVSNAIYNEGTVVFAGSKTITLNDSITGTANRVYTKNGTGTLVLANDMSGVLGDVILNRGTVKIASGGNFFSSDTTRAKKVEVAGGGVLLDVKNDNIETVDLGNLVLTKDLNIAVDVDLSKTGTAAIDNFKTTGEITGNKSIIIDTIKANMHAINDLAASPKPSASGDSTEYEARRVVTQIADASIADKFKLASHISLDTREVIDGSTNNHDSSGTSGLGWFMYYNSSTGELHFIDQSLRATLKDTSDDTKKYIMTANETVEGHLNNILGTAGDTSTNTTVQIAGQNNKILGNGFKGVIVESGQKFIVEKVSEASGFAKSSDNGAFINVKADGEAYITDSTIKSNSVNNAQGGAVYLNDGTLVLDGATFDSNSATKTGSSGGSGGAIYNYQGTISEATGASQSTFTGNSAAVNGGAIGNVGSSNTEKAIIESLNAQFTNNSAASNGGAIYNRLGDINSLTGTFTSNTADNGGAIYNFSGTINLDNATFVDNGATTAGGAINNATSTATINMSDVTFNAPTGTNANDIYNVGTMNVTGGTNTFASDITNTGSIDFGGTNTISAAINATATGSNKIAFTGTNELTSTATMSGDMALTNSGDLTLNNNLSGYTGNYTQTAGSTDVKSTATLFGGTNTVQGGTMALDWQVLWMFRVVRLLQPVHLQAVLQLQLMVVL